MRFQRCRRKIKGLSSSNMAMAELDVVILKVNDIDVGQLSKDEVVQMFLTANQPLRIELRRTSKMHSSKTDADENLDIINSKLANLKFFRPINHLSINNDASDDEHEFLLTMKLPVTTNILPLTNEQAEKVTPSLTKFTQTDEVFFNYNHERVNEAANRLIEEEHHLFEQCLAPEIDIEEITLRKSDSNERLGLVVCYSNCSNNGSGNNYGALSGSDDNEICTEVYISDIQPDSVAGRDGRLRQGDQILQINGKDIKNKEDTESLIAENTNAVTLLVSRYLYTDDDDFNDPSVADIEIEEDEDDDECDDEEEDEEEEFYDENTLAYENCFLANDYRNVVEELEKVLPSSNAFGGMEKSMPSGPAKPNEEKSCLTIKLIDPKCRTASGEPLTTDELQLLKHHTKSREALQGSSISGSATGSTTASGSSSKSSTAITTSAGHLKSRTPTIPPPLLATATAITGSTIDYETEHIYETIPEDSESEPFYCSPYESRMAYITALDASCPMMNTVDALQLQQQKQRVAQWLGIWATSQPGTATTTSMATAPRQSIRSSNGCGRSSITHVETSKRSGSGTVRSAVTNGSGSSGGGGVAGNGGVGVGVGSGGSGGPSRILGDDHDNSSSAYNTGGSNNSGTPLDHQRLQSPKEKFITSPKMSANKGSGAGGGGGNLMKGSAEGTDPLGPRIFATSLTTATTTAGDFQQSQQQAPQYSSKTQLRNEANLYQTMLLQKYIYKQQQQHPCVPQPDFGVVPPYGAMPCPQFTAPNLSQYHFVSSQEVSAAHLNTQVSPAIDDGIPKKPNEDQTMVWKVKRRQDGSRYIVRRPARNRLMRDRTVKLCKHEVTTTTEDDTISEVKIGRYWSKEERKKHIERARERRQQHLQQQLQQQSPLLADSVVISTMRLSEKAKLQQKRERSLNRQQHQQQQQQEFLPLSQKTAATHIHRLGTTMPQPKVLQQHQLQFNSHTSSNHHHQENKNLRICSPIELSLHPAVVGPCIMTTTITTAVATITTTAIQNHPASVPVPVPIAVATLPNTNIPETTVAYNNHLIAASYAVTSSVAASVGETNS